MIPLRLTLHNFMCYREGLPPLDLAAIRLACLTGENGAGKSALLDAITWAVWGKGRVNSDLDLMSLGATEMRVEFEFRLGDQDYRIARRRTRRGAATGWLDLHVLDPATGAWRSLTGDGVRETQRAIVELLRMEYDTFINSAFLLQGRADEFTTKPPARRKEVLGEILGLAVYDDLEKRARECFKTLGDEVRALDGECERLRTIADREPVHLAELERLSAALMEQDIALERLQVQHEQTRQALDLLRQEAEQLAAARALLESDEHDRRQEDLAAANCRRELARHEALLARREVIEAGADELAAAQRRRAELDGAAGQARALERARATAERALERERQHLLGEQRALTGRLADLNRVVATLPGLEERRAAAALAAAAATLLGEEIATQVAAERQAHGEIEALKGRNGSLLTEAKRLKDRQGQIDAADAACPVCRRPLGPAEKAHSHDEYEREGKALKAEFERNKRRVEELTAEGQRLTTSIKHLERQREQALGQGREEARLAEQLRQARQAEVDLATSQLRLIDLTTVLEQGAYAREERATLAGLAQQMAALAYDEAAHEAARATEARLAPFADERAAVREAARQAPREREMLTAHEAASARLGERIAHTRERVLLLSERVRALPALTADEQALFGQVEARRRERDLSHQQLGAVQQQLAACQAAGESLAAQLAERARLAAERELYQDLVEAFGKKGIQAMLIETVVPELQDEANALLDRMPGNTMRVEFLTQRDSRTGETIETLDVIIKDEVGARKYELYSGGEAFRINFAIRVALSKLLARRAGAQLQLLVIDEGFGTQDARGREGLVEAIRAIEDDFAMILVVTHLADIRDEFTSRITVTKTTEGSLATVYA